MSDNLFGQKKIPRGLHYPPLGIIDDVGVFTIEYTLFSSLVK